ncbi:hypothetical protein ETB97_002568 [Aspergillus alliaceus]|uniref:Major facilitator superfamily domain-containing protein n=1 Tax=Petromyces alliaceus TaxID=209559 RepID=A0A8H6A183_PETAA|nr:hypothetical protein ETB97_002568 [Aspergillus burnettii]
MSSVWILSPIEDVHTEVAPFLQADRDYDRIETAMPGIKDDFDEQNPPKWPCSGSLIALFFIFLAIEMGIRMLLPPLGRIIESIVCLHYWEVHDPGRIGPSGRVPEKLCKITEVQTVFAVVEGYWFFFHSLLSALFAIPYSLLADKLGCKRVLRLTVAGFLLNGIMLTTPLYYSNIFPAPAIWLAPLSWVVGGGPVFLFAILWNRVAEVTEDAQREIVFLRLGVTTMVADFIASAIGSGLMNLDPWIPFMMGHCFNLVGLIGVLFLRETTPVFSPSACPERLCSIENAFVEECTPIHYEDQVDRTCCGSYACNTDHNLPSLAIRVKLRRVITTYLSLFTNYRILLLLPAFFICNVIGGSGFLVQYISVRFAWTLASASLVVSLQPALNIPVLFFILPYISKRLHRRVSPQKTEIYLSRFSIVCLTLSIFGVGISSSLFILLPSMMLHAAGSGFLLLARSIITRMVETDKTTKLYTILEGLQAVGNVVAIFILTNVFRMGLGLGGAWIGLTWLVTGVLFAVMGLGVWMI